MAAWLGAFLLIAIPQGAPEAEVAALLVRLKSTSASEREAATKALNRLVQRPREGSAGFSDRPVDRPPEGPKLTPELYDRVATALGEAANDGSPDVRKAAAIALSGVFGDRRPVKAALVRALESKDGTVAWYVVQAFDHVLPEADAAVPALTSLLEVEDDNARHAAAEALGRYGSRARGAVPPLLRLVPGKGQSMAPWGALNALAAIGVDEAQAKTLASLEWPEPGFAGLRVFEILLPHPELATTYLEKRPNLPKLAEDSPQLLFRVVESSDPKAEGLRKMILDHPDLPPAVMAWTREPRYLPAIRERFKTAGTHERAFLLACARACGDPPDQVVALSEKEAGGFKPKSAWPGVDDSRKGDGLGHGDGQTPVLVTGRLLLEEGSPAIEPRLINVNDRMLLGRRTSEPAPLSYDPKTGRFVFYTNVFAAYSMGKGRREQGPYQTGSAQVRIEAKGSRPLTVQFYDEMPEVKITLTPAK